MSRDPLRRPVTRARPAFDFDSEFNPAHVRRDGFDLTKPHKCGSRRGVFNRYGPACRRCGRTVPAPDRSPW